MTPTGRSSRASSLASSLGGPDQIRELIGKLSEDEAATLLYDWQFWARPAQLLPGTPGAEHQRRDWSYWLLQAGRGFGKTRTGAETVRQWVEAGRRRIAIVAPTAADARDVMVEGESGLLSVCPSYDRPVYEPSKRQVTWPKRGAIAKMYSADEPERLRGPQHEAAWCDELASWRYGQDAWDNLMFGLRLGSNPQAVITTTPKPIKLLRELVRDPNTVITRGSTYENQANVAPVWLEKILKKYEGTRLGRQELMAELLEDLPGALWTRRLLEELRVVQHRVPQLVRVCVGVDPAVTSGPDADETGVVVMGLGVDNHLYVLEDASLRGSPAQWAATVVRMALKWQADRIVGEVNNGGDLVEANLRHAVGGGALPYRAVRASRGKLVRAEPVAALYEQGRAHHVGAQFEALEDQMCSFVAGESDESPDRMDAMVWAATDLVIQAEEQAVITWYNWDAGNISPI